MGIARTQNLRLPNRTGAHQMWLWRRTSGRGWVLAGGGRLAGVGAEAKLAWIAGECRLIARMRKQEGACAECGGI